MDNNLKKLLAIFLAIVLIITFVEFGGKKGNSNESDSKIRVVTSFYPIYIMALNIADGANDVNVSNMSENLRGCIHDYTLSTDDLKKVENADVFIETGENLEPFSDKIKSTYPNLKVIDSGKNVPNLIKSDSEVNPHIWLDFSDYISQVNEISNELIEINPDNKEIYEKNNDIYCKKINDLESKFKKLDLKDVGAVCLDESLEYLLEENEMNVISIETDHENSALSADVVNQTISKMKQENIKLVFIDKDSSDKNALMLAEETGARVFRLNSAMNSNEANIYDNNELNSYIDAMNENYKVLENCSKIK